MDGLQENLKLGLHAPRYRVAEHELLSLVAKEVTFEHNFLVDETGVEHFEKAKLLEHPLQHRLVLSLGRHHFNISGNLQQSIELCQRAPVQRVQVYVGQLLQDHLLQSNLESPLRRM